MDEHFDALDRVVRDVVAPQARVVDRDGTFPLAAIEELGRAGVLGMTAAEEVGGSGEGIRTAAGVVERLAGVCGSTAMVVLMHYAAVAVLEAQGPRSTREAVANGRHLSTLAFSEDGSRSQFWMPLGTAEPDADGVRLDATKSWVTSAGEADSYVWSSRPLLAEGQMTLWLVPSNASGLSRSGGFDGFGLRGNGSEPVRAEGVVVERSAMLGADGAGLDVALSAALPWFLVLSAAFSLGLMEAVTEETGRHLSATRLEHLGQTLVEQPVTRADYARMRLQTDSTGALVRETVDALEAGHPDATLRVLEVKAAAGEAAAAVTDTAMKLCGGAAFRKDVGIERRFRDARASRVMAPTTDALLDFIGRAISGLPLLDQSR
ncbi:MAG: acyl-CoA dehydrogenase family protein [Acidimicrobiales bacterium]